jgi:peroxiredoxin
MGVRRELASVGRQAPDFRLATPDGGMVGLQELASAGPVVLVFFKVSCPTCQLTLPYLERLKDNGKLRIVAISQDDAASTRRFHQAYGITLQTLLDDRAAGYPASNAYGISQVPTAFQVEPDGTVSSVREGFSKAEMEALGQRAGMAVFGPADHVPLWKPG